MSGSDLDAVVTIKVDALTKVTLGVGRASSLTAAATMAPMATGDFGWLLRGTEEKKG
jgi:hypothetical protein